jgi:hypothetical protein
MEPRREEEQKTPDPGAEPKRRRFRIVKLEERIAPTSPSGSRSCQRHTFQCGGSNWCTGGPCY